MKRIFDILSSSIGLLLLFPVLATISVIIVLDSKGGIFYKQIRVGRNNKDFFLYKFRTMIINADSKGQLTVGERDVRITKVGYFLRKYKLDELPQLLNIIVGEMSVVGPRPEVRKYVDLYSKEQLKVLSVKPGLTDYASILYSNENEILGMSNNPEQTYINVVMPHKLNLGIEYINDTSFYKDFKIILKTLKKLYS